MWCLTWIHHLESWNADGPIVMLEHYATKEEAEAAGGMVSSRCKCEVSDIRVTKVQLQPVWPSEINSHLVCVAEQQDGQPS